MSEFLELIVAAQNLASLRQVDPRPQHWLPKIAEPFQALAHRLDRELTRIEPAAPPTT